MRKPPRTNTVPMNSTTSRLTSQRTRRARRCITWGCGVRGSNRVPRPYTNSPAHQLTRPERPIEERLAANREEALAWDGFTADLAGVSSRTLDASGPRSPAGLPPALTPNRPDTQPIRCAPVADARSRAQLEGVSVPISPL